MRDVGHVAPQVLGDVEVLSSWSGRRDRVYKMSESANTGVPFGYVASR
jgi:hypothetical protein